MFKSHTSRLWAIVLLLGFQVFFSCDSEDPVAEPDAIIGLWNFESQELVFYLNGAKLSQAEVDFYTAIAGVDVEDFQIPDDASFEFMEDGKFEGNASGFDPQTGNWLLSEDPQTLNLSSESSLLFLDTENLPELAQDVFFEEDGSIAFQVLELTNENASFFLEGETDVEVTGFGTQTIKVELTINLVK